MTRRNIINTFALAPVLPWLTLKGIENPCKKTDGFYVRVFDPNGAQRTFFFPTTMKCEEPREEE